MIDFKKHKVLVCAGTGGVGKTTVAASIAVAAAEAGLRVLVLTIDPAKRLATALGLNQADLDEPRLVPGQNFSGRLWASMVDPQRVFDRFVRESAPNKEVADRLLSNVLYKQLSTTLSGSQEFTSLELLLRAHESQLYDLIVLDTPPSQHAIDFLQAPEKIYSLFQKSITQWFIRGTEKGGLWVNLFHKGTQLAMDALEKLTGEGFLRELSGFFENMAELQRAVSARSLAVHQLLSGPQTAFALITATDPIKLREAELFQQDLVSTGARLSYLIVNRTTPTWLVDLSSTNWTADLQDSAAALHKFYEKVLSYYHQMDEHIADIQSRLSPDVEIYKIAEMSEEVVGLEGLKKVSTMIQPWRT